MISVRPCNSKKGFLSHLASLTQPYIILSVVVPEARRRVSDPHRTVCCKQAKIWKSEGVAYSTCFTQYANGAVSELFLVLSSCATKCRKLVYWGGQRFRKLAACRRIGNAFCLLGRPHDIIDAWGCQHGLIKFHIGEL